MERIERLISAQREYFLAGNTLDVNVRLKNLHDLKRLILDHEEEIAGALWKDFRKPYFEVIATETRFVVQEINLALGGLRRWARPRRVRTPLLLMPGRSYILPRPYGQVLVFSPWNYPVQLALCPVVSALAAGNCVILKASNQTKHTLDVLEKIVGAFPPGLLAMVRGGHDASDFLLEQPFDHIFFTGSQAIGQRVMEKAAKRLIPVTLELGGKNPCVLAADAQLESAVKRIAWGKFLNAGQTCVGVDYVLVDKKIREQFLSRLTETISRFFGAEPSESLCLSRIINQANAERLSGLISRGNILTGGQTDTANRYVSPTVLVDVDADDPVMKEEIFGPVLPVIDYEHFGEVFDIIARHPKPLAAYLFTTDKRKVKEFLHRVRAGATGINDTVLQIANPHLPYGGVGNSGTGKYHGKHGFELMSNLKSVYQRHNLLDPPVRYAPYKEACTRIVRWLIG